MFEFIKENIHWFLMGLMTILFLISVVATRKELPFNQAKAKIVAAAILFAKIDGTRILGDLENEFMSFMNKHCDEFRKLLKSKNLLSLRENINIEDMQQIGKLFADFKARFEQKAANAM